MYKGLASLCEIGKKCGIGAAGKALGSGIVKGFKDWSTTSDSRRFGQSFGTVLLAAIPAVKGSGLVTVKTGGSSTAAQLMYGRLSTMFGPEAVGQWANLFSLAASEQGLALAAMKNMAQTPCGRAQLVNIHKVTSYLMNFSPKNDAAFQAAQFLQHWSRVAANCGLK